MNAQYLHTKNKCFQFRHWSWLLIVFVTLCFVEGNSQGINNTHNAFVIGQVVHENNNRPINGQVVIIEADTTYDANFHYNKKVYTDKDGLFYDTIQTKFLKGALIITVIDCYGQKHDTTCYFRFNWNENNYLQPDFHLPSAFGTNSPQADFSFERDPLGNNNLTYAFFDNTNETNAISWTWDFGDGIVSNEQNPIHTFEEPGVYHIKLSVLVQDPMFVDPISTCITKVVKASLKNYFHLGGHVKADYFPIDHGEAYLYKIEEKDFVIIDTAVFNDDLGFYLFPQVIEGNYLVKADLHPTSVLFNQFLQTYYSNQYLWEEADTIFHTFTNTEYDINLIPNTNLLLPGPGTLAGKIIYDAGLTGGSKTGPACNIQILLFEKDGGLVEVCHSNDQGQFELGNLDLQSYDIYAEVTGKFTIPLTVELEPGNTLVNQITLIISSSLVHGSYTYGIGDNNSDSKVGNVYPNPVQDQLHLDIELTSSDLFEVSVIDSYGKIINNYSYYGNQGLNKIQINTDNISSGLYFISVSQNSGKKVSQMFIKK